MHIYISLGSEYTNLPQIIIPCKERAIFGIPSFLSFLITAFTFAFFLWCWRSIQMLGNLEEHSLAGLLSAQSKSGRGQQGSPSTATNDQTFRHDHLQKLTASSLVLDILIYICQGCRRFETIWCPGWDLLKLIILMFYCLGVLNIDP